MRTSLCITFSLLATASFAGEPAVKSPVAPEDSLHHFVLSPALDLRIDLVAVEPQVVDPVAIAFDEHARMYVVEMRDYPNGPAEGQPPLSRVRLLEDANGDGRFETTHVFAEGLLFATGVLPWDGGAIVTLAGEIRFLKDTDGDHEADVNELWFSGFSEGNPQLRANHPTFGPDGWIYVANGLRGGKVQGIASPWKGVEIELRDHDFRFNPRTGEAEAIAGGGQFGLAFDAWGNRFICSNRNPCDHVVLELADLERNPHLAIGRPIQVVAAAGDDSRVFPLVDAWTTSTLHSGQFTAACGLKVFTGDALPASCVGNAFTCEPTGSLVHREVLEPVGGTFRGTPGEKEAEFLASGDPWFRPVNLATGPDGALYVVDMYRAVIEHPEWMPEELKRRRDLRWGDDCGRIYRVAAKDKPPGKLPTLEDATPEEIAKSIDSPNGWTRDTAVRLLAHRNSEAELERIAREGATAEGRVRAMQVLNERHPTRASLSWDDDPRAVAATLRADGKYAEFAVSRLLPLAESDDARLRFGAARTVAASYERVPNQSAEVIDVLATVAARDAGDLWTRAAVLSSTGNPLALYDAVAARNADGAVPFLVDLAELIGRRREKEELTGLLSRLASTGPEQGWATAILIAFGRGLGGSLEPALQVADDPTRRRLEAAFAWAAAVVGDSNAPAVQRAEWVRLVALSERSFAVPSLLDLAAVPALEVRLAVVESLGRFRGDDRIAPALLSGFDAQPPALRRAILDALLADPSRAGKVIDAVAAGELSAAELGPTRINALSKHSDPAVREKAASLFAPAADRQKVLADYATALSMKADLARGRAVFEKSCATCHRIAGLGTQVGPDIADSRTRTPEALLVDLLDPNRAIDGRYVAYSIATADGAVLTGLIEGETSNAVTLSQPEGKRVTILRDEIEEMRSDGTSLMPVGLERSLSQQDVADLIGFIKNWRYLDGAVPLDSPE